MYNGSAWLHGNTIRNNSRHGVYIYQSSPTLTQNNITATTSTGNAAVVCASSSHPIFGDLYDQIEGRNTLTGGYYGLHATYYSNPLLGSGTQPLFENRLVGNTYANAFAEMSSTVYAQYCWWGQSPPDASKIIATSGSVIYYNPWLTIDPNQQQGPQSAEGGQVASLGGPLDPRSLTGLRDLLLNARELRLQGQHSSAVNIYRTIITTAPDSAEARSALVELGNVYRETNDRDLLNYIGSFTARSNRLRAFALETLANCYIVDGNRSAISTIDSILIGDFGGTIHEKNGRMNQFFVHLNSREYDPAREQLRWLAERHPTDDAVATASWIINLVGEGVIVQPGGLGKTNLGQTLAFNLELGNYPNPFNPTTTLSFDLPEPAIVSLVVYDVLGRKVAELAEGSYGAGIHTAIWNAEQQASGVYFARFVVTSSSGEVKYSKVNKLVLMK